MAVANRAGQFITFPTDGRRIPCIKEGLMDVTGFPNDLGCVDGSLIPTRLVHLEKTSMFVVKGSTL